jgi:hypothetical protein
MNPSNPVVGRPVCAINDESARRVISATRARVADGQQRLPVQHVPWRSCTAPARPGDAAALGTARLRVCFPSPGIRNSSRFGGAALHKRPRPPRSGAALPSYHGHDHSQMLKQAAVSAQLALALGPSQR